MNFQQQYIQDPLLDGRDPISCMTIESHSEIHNGKSQSQGIMILSESNQIKPPPSNYEQPQERIQYLTSIDEIVSQPELIIVEAPPAAVVQEPCQSGERRAEWKLAEKASEKQKAQERVLHSSSPSPPNSSGYRLIKPTQKGQEQAVQLPATRVSARQHQSNYKQPNYNEEIIQVSYKDKSLTSSSQTKLDPPKSVPSKPQKMAKYRECSPQAQANSKTIVQPAQQRPKSKSKIQPETIHSSEFISEGSLSDLSSKKEGGRERKHNPLFHNSDFITSGDLSGNSRNKKRSYPTIEPSMPLPSKKHQKNPKSDEKRTNEFKIDLKNIFDRENLKRSKKAFFNSFNQAAPAKGTQKDQPQPFSFKDIQIPKEQQSSHNLLNERVAYFSPNPNQKFIEETFEEDVIFLVNNSNQNVEIKVKRTPLDKGAMNKKTAPGTDPLAHVVNRFDEKARTQFFSRINFIKDYKTGYAPIEIQQQQEKELDDMKVGEEEETVTHKQHFIRRKQAQNISLKRSCGVSYVKQPESKQENVGDIYERLPQLVFQCSNGIPKLLEHEQYYARLYERIFHSSWLVCTYFESEDETLMRDYLLYPDQRWSLCKGKYFIMKDVNQIWPLFIERQFLCIHFLFDNKELIKCPNLKDFSVEEIQNIVKHSNIHLGLLFKKSINGKKAFKKSLGEAFMGDLANHPSSQSAASKEKKMKKLAAKLLQASEATAKAPTSSSSSVKSSQMSKADVNKIFKQIKAQLKEDKFLQDLPIFKKRFQSIKDDFMLFSKKLSPGMSIIPSEELIKNIESLESNDEKSEALLELMELIHDRISEGEEQQSIDSQSTAAASARKESTKLFESLIPNATPSKIMEIEEQSTVAQTQEVISQETSIQFERIVEEVVAPEQSQQEQQQQQIPSVQVTASPSQQQENQTNIEIEESQLNENKSSGGVQVQTTVDCSGDSSCQSPIKPSVSPPVEININESNQNAQNFHEIEQKLSSQQCSSTNCSSPEGTQTNKLAEYSPSALNSQATSDLQNSQPLNNEVLEIENDEKTTQIIEETHQTSRVVPKESLICQEVLDYIDRDLSSKNINTLSAKLELYVEESGWKGSSGLVKSLLSTFILYAKDQFEKLALNMMNTRFAVVRENDESRIENCLQNIRFINKPSTKRRPVFENLAASKNKKWDFPQAVSESIFNNQRLEYNLEKLASDTTPVSMGKLLDKEDNYSVLKKGEFNMPLYYIATRDSFAFDLIEKISTCRVSGKEFTKTEYFFDRENYPTNFKSFISSFPDFRVGTTLYTGFFSHQELKEIEDSCYETEVKSFQRHYYPMTAQMTCTAQKIRRTKFFFGSRYIWTRQQLSEPHSFVGAGVRQDVSEPPAWMRSRVVRPLEKAGILPDGYINSLALNVYHDGKEGLAQHFDDATRFMQPIFTFKLFSDARLSFGSQLYGFCNSAFVIPMPRGSILKLEENSYAANGIKHCVRPCDMSGKNATIIMRQMHHRVVNEANIYDQYVDLPTWISTASCKPEALPYGEQKTIEADYLLRNGPNACS